MESPNRSRLSIVPRLKRVDPWRAESEGEPGAYPIHRDPYQYVPACGGGAAQPKVGGLTLTHRWQCGTQGTEPQVAITNPMPWQVTQTGRWAVRQTLTCRLPGAAASS